MSSQKIFQTSTNDLSSFDFLLLCKSCNDILCHSREIEKLHVLLNELVLIVSENNPHLIISDEAKIKSDSSCDKHVDYQCVYKEILCKKCQSNIGIYYVATKEIMDILIEKTILFECKLKFYSISQNKYENFREFCFENSLIESNLDHIYLLEDQKNEKKQGFEKFKENVAEKNEEFPEFGKIVDDVKQAFLAMNEGMKVFEDRLSQSEQTVGTLLALVDKINRRVQSHFY